MATVTPRRDGPPAWLPPGRGTTRGDDGVAQGPKPVDEASHTQAAASAIPVPVERRRIGALARRLALVRRLARRVVRHPAYALHVLRVLLGNPRLLLRALRHGWRTALLDHCQRLTPDLAGILTRYDAGFFAQVFLFDEYEVERLPLGPTAQVLDVGANIGLFSWRVGRSHPGARILALEPQSENCVRLRQVAAATGIQVEVCPCACGAFAGTARLYLRSSVTHSLDPAWHLDLADQGAARRSEQVEVTTVDAVCDRRGLEGIDLLKVDVEGAEVDVLRGASAMLARTRFVVLEYHSPDRRAACIELLRTAGFRCRDKSFWGLAAGNEGEGLLLADRPTASA